MKIFAIHLPPIEEGDFSQNKLKYLKEMRKCAFNMNKIKLKDIQKLVKENFIEKGTIMYNEKTVFTVRTSLLLGEKAQLIDDAVKNSYIDYITPSLLHAQSTLRVGFVQLVCPEFEFPMSDGIVDIEQAEHLLESIGFIERYSAEVNKELYFELYVNLRKRIELETAKVVALYAKDSSGAEILENVSDFTFQLIKVGNKFNKILDSVDELVDKSKGKILKAMTQTKVNAIFEKLKNLVSEQMPEDDFGIVGAEYDNVVNIGDVVNKG